jgi:hypothetical protein
MSDDKTLARIAALLRQADGTDNAHQAEAFMAAAQRLATATSIDLAVARSHSAMRTGEKRYGDESATRAHPQTQTIVVGDQRSGPVCDRLPSKNSRDLAADVRQRARDVPA